MLERNGEVFWALFAIFEGRLRLERAFLAVRMRAMLIWVRFFARYARISGA
jgi:hypothetical protein